MINSTQFLCVFIALFDKSVVDNCHEIINNNNNFLFLLPFTAHRQSIANIKNKKTIHY